MSIETYFEREYNYLQIAGKAFAEKHPKLGSKLHLSERERKDPFVERLFEAFAFLAARIHERLDDEIPEITGGLLEQLFPHFLRPFPSCAILKVEPNLGVLKKAIMIPRHSEVQTVTGSTRVKYKVPSGPEADDHTSEKTEPAEFIFRTTRNLKVRPMRLKAVRTEQLPNAATALILQIHPDRNVDYESLDLDRLTIYLHGQESLKYNLMLLLTKYLSALSIVELVGESPKFVDIKPFQIGIAELSIDLDDDSEEYSILPYARQTFSGYRLLQEYFAFPERFFFIDILGLNQFKASRDGHPFEIKFSFSKRLSTEFKITADNILLHCTPIVNLFNDSTEQVSITQRLPEYYIIPDLNRRKSKEIYTVNKVTGVSENKTKHFDYIPVTSYDILNVNDHHYDTKRFYSCVRRPISSDMAETYIRIFGTSMEQDILSKETLSIEATLSNGFLPAEYLEKGSITEPVNFPSGVKITNLTKPSNVLLHPPSPNFLWTLISHLTLSYSTLANSETLKNILSLYNWSEGINPNKKKIDSIKKVHEPETKNIYRNRGLIRGIEFKIEIDPAQFDNGEADIHLFGLVLSRFLSQYITINSFVILTMIESGTGNTYTWNPSLGKILPV